MFRKLHGKVRGWQRYDVCPLGKLILMGIICRCQFRHVHVQILISNNLNFCNYKGHIGSHFSAIKSMTTSLYCYGIMNCKFSNDIA